MDVVIAMGIPTAITGFLVWWLKKYIDRNEQRAVEREKNTETLMTLIMQTSRSNNVLAEATARAVQRIPDAKCNGDMTSALAKAAHIREEEEKFLADQGLKHIFGD